MVLLGLPAVTLWAPGAPALFGKSVGDSRSVAGRSCSDYSLSLWVSPACAAAASCHIGLNVNMLPLSNGALLTCFQTGVGFKSTCILPVSFLDDVHTHRVPVYTVYTRSCASVYVAVHQSY